MFILRVIINMEQPTYDLHGNRKEGSVHTVVPAETLETNLVLGDSYNVIHEQTAHEEFKTICKQCHSPEKAFAAVVYNHGADVRFLWKGQENFIMTSTGKTFSRIRE